MNALEFEHAGLEEGEDLQVRGRKKGLLAG